MILFHFVLTYYAEFAKLKKDMGGRVFEKVVEGKKALESPELFFSLHKRTSDCMTGVFLSVLNTFSFL